MIILPRIKVIRRFSDRFLLFGFGKFWFDLGSDKLRDFILKFKEIIKISIKPVCPDVASSCTIDQLCVNSHAIP